MSRIRRVICLRCGQDRRHHARGLCKTCVRHLTEDDQIHLYPPLGRGGRPKRAPVIDSDPDPIAFQGTWVRRGLTYYPLKETA